MYKMKQELFYAILCHAVALDITLIFVIKESVFNLLSNVYYLYLLLLNFQSTEVSSSVYESAFDLRLSVFLSLKVFLMF